MKIKKIILDKIKEYDISKLGESDIEALDISDALEVIIELDDIYNNRHRYKLEYAYMHAQRTINEFYRNSLRDFEQEKEKYICSDSEQHHITKFVYKISRNIKKLHVNYKSLNIVIIIVSIILSMGLILGIHWTTDHLVSRFQEIFDAFVIVFVFGALKLFIEEKLFNKRIEGYGWRKYRKSVDTTEKNFAMVILSHLVIKKANQTGLLIKQLVGQDELFLDSLHNHSKKDV